MGLLPNNRLWSSGKAVGVEGGGRRFDSCPPFLFRFFFFKVKEHSAHNRVLSFLRGFDARFNSVVYWLRFGLTREGSQVQILSLPHFFLV
jgi:hypothetical protein